MSFAYKLSQNEKRTASSVTYLKQIDFKVAYTLARVSFCICKFLAVNEDIKKVLRGDKQNCCSEQETRGATSVDAALDLRKRNTS